MAQLTVLLPDIHLPYEDKRAVANVLDMIQRVQPDRVLQLGDLLDCKAPARWSRGRAEEYVSSMREEVTAGSRFWESLRQAVPTAELFWCGGNHDLGRLHSYINSYAPALKDIVPSMPELMEFEKHGVQEVKNPWPVAPGVIAIHGDKLSPVAGMSARKELLRHGKSIVQGHTHRQALLWESTDRHRFALEGGWLGDIKKATYLSFPGVANWQQGFGYLYVDGQRVTPGVVPVHQGGRFVFNGRKYGS